MAAITNKKLSFNTAEQFKESFSELNPTIAYVFFGNHVPYANESSPDSIVDTISAEKNTWDNIFAGKRATGNDVELVVPKINWTSNTKFNIANSLATITIGTNVAVNGELRIVNSIISNTNISVSSAWTMNASAQTLIIVT